MYTAFTPAMMPKTVSGRRTIMDACPVWEIVYVLHFPLMVCSLRAGDPTSGRRATAQALYSSQQQSRGFLFIFFCLTHSPSSPLLHQPSQSRSPVRRYKRSRRWLLSLPQAVVFSLALVVCTEETSAGVRRSYRLHRLSQTAGDI